ncbi:oxidoreductase [Desulfovibrio sp.]
MTGSASDSPAGGAALLFEPCSFAGRRLKNRLAALPLFTGYAYPDGHVSPLLLEHYWRLAGSGVGLVVVGNVAVARDGVTAPNNLRLDNDEFLPGMARLAKVIRDAGAVACAQLNHAGRFARTELPLMPAPMDASHLAFDVASLKAFMESFPLEERFGLTWMVMRKAASWQSGMSREQRAAVILAFAGAAARAVAAGFEMIELHGATGYLLTQFLSAYTNRPAYGGVLPLVRRASFPLEVFRAVRAAVPPDFPVGFRLLTREWTPDGVDLPEALDFAAMLEKEGASYFSVSAGTYNSIFNPEVRRRTARPGYLREDSAALKARVRVPVITAGKILTPALAGRILAAGEADLIGLGRPLLADGEWPRKAREGVPVNACIDCFECLKRIVLDKGLNCVRRPEPQRKRVDLEYSFLNRNAFRTLVAVTSIADLELLRSYWRERIPARDDLTATLLFLHPEGGDVAFALARDSFRQWAREAWRRLGFDPGRLRFKDRTLRGGPENLILDEAEAGGFGVVLLCRDPGAAWTERVLLAHDGISGVIGPHPAQDRILVPFDFSPTSLLALRYVVHAYYGAPGCRLTFAHILENGSGDAEKRWREAKGLAGLDEDVPLLLVRGAKGTARDILDLALREEVGKIIMGRRGQSGLRRFLLGSVSAGVLRGLTGQSLTLVA